MKLNDVWWAEILPLRSTTKDCDSPVLTIITMSQKDYRNVAIKYCADPTQFDDLDADHATHHLPSSPTNASSEQQGRMVVCRSGSIQMLLVLVLPTRRTITKEFAPIIKILNKTASMSVLIEADMFSAGILLPALAQG